MQLKDAGIYDFFNLFKADNRVNTQSEKGVINSKDRLINIPAYQRPYRWKEDNIDRLFQDYEDNIEGEYFIGSAVLVEKKDKDPLEYDVVDGQQRITTIFLLNYIRFLLKRENVFNNGYDAFSFPSLCSELKDCYVDLIGKKNVKRFEAIENQISKVIKDRDSNTTDKERLEQLFSCYREQMCIPENQNTPEETNAERIKKAYEFLDPEQLCLKYTRLKYDLVLKDALCHIYLQADANSSNYLFVELEDERLEQNVFVENYLNALKKIFEKVWSHVESDEDLNIKEKCTKAIEFLDTMISQLSICIILTEEESDANKLFEVLNDRALDVDDLELIKNHFYKEYCTKSKDTDPEKDERIATLDEIWTDKIFASSNKLSYNRLISYLSAVYLTKSKELTFKDDSKFKNEIEIQYSKKYSKESNPYSYDHILSDFNVYFANKIIIEKMELETKKVEMKTIVSENSDKSIIYKAFRFLNAKTYHSVLPALTNVIISYYVKNYGTLSDENFEKKFSEYLSNLINKQPNDNEKYLNVYRCANVLRVAALKGKDHNKAREIARGLIEKYGYGSEIPEDIISLTVVQNDDLNKEFDYWTNNWTFSCNKKFDVKLLLLDLLRTSREKDDNKNYVLKESALTYNLDLERLELDHLEPNSPGPISELYFSPKDSERRNSFVNHNIGNFMILDKTYNDSKTNIPLIQAMTYYKVIEDSWLIEDINGMINNERFFDMDKKIPREEFFTNRTKQLKEYFKAYLDCNIDKKSFSVKLSDLE